MVMKTLNGQGTLQLQRTSQPAPRAAAAAAQDAQRAADRALADQIRDQVRSSIAAARQSQGQVGIPAPPTPPDRREFVFTDQQGRRTTVGMPPPNEIIPQQAVDISIAFFLTIAAIIIGLPLARAFARRMDRKSGGTAQIPSEVTAQLTHLSQAVDAIAVEVERISEGQRFTTRLLSEQRDAAHQTLPSGSGR
jgi:hypothetical protein